MEIKGETLPNDVFTTIYYVTFNSPLTSLTIGDNELAENTANLKNMRTGEATPVALTAEAIGAVLAAR